MFVVLASENAKIGPAAATYAPVAQTCPASCPMKDNGCYAQDGNVGIHNRRREAQLSGLSGDTVAMLEAAEITHMARYAPPGWPLRLHVSGDSSTPFAAELLADAATAWPGPVWTYTHAWRTVPRESWGPVSGSVSVLASCESLTDVSEALSLGYAAAVVVDSHPADGKAWVDEKTGVKVIPCPSQTRGALCTDCRLCWDDTGLHEHRSAIAFAAHGPRKKRALKVIQERGTPLGVGL